MQPILKCYTFSEIWNPPLEFILKIIRSAYSCNFDLYMALLSKKKERKKDKEMSPF